MGSQTLFDNYLGQRHEMEDQMDYGGHKMLIESVNQMDDYQRIKPPSRTEASLQISEFHLPSFKGGNVHLRDLTKSLQAHGKSYGKVVVNKLKRLERGSRPLCSPLEKPEQDRIKRVVGYRNVTRKVERWDAIVHANKASRSLKFPMNVDSVKMQHTTDFLSKESKPSDLEKGINTLLGRSTVAQEDRKVEEKFKLTLAELREKRKEMAKFRAQQSYEIVKAKRLKKIKSKSYRRSLIRKKMYSQLKDFEALQKTDPEAALKQLEQFEEARAEERMTLRHKSTGTWARSRLIRAKYDRQTRVELAEQLAKSRELTKKLNVNDSEDEHDNPGTRKEVEKMFEGDAGNPWITVKPKLEILDFVSGYRKYWKEKSKQEKLKENEVRRQQKKKKTESELKQNENKRNAKEKTKSSPEPPRDDKHLEINGVSKRKDKGPHLSSAAQKNTSTSIKPDRNADNSLKAPKTCDVEDGQIMVNKKNIERKQNESSSAPKPNISKKSQYVTNVPPKSLKNRKSTHGVWEVTSIAQNEPEKSTECIELDWSKSSLRSDDEELLGEGPDSRLRNFKSYVEESSAEVKKDKRKRKKKTEIEKLFNDKMSEEIQKKIDKIKADLQSDSKVNGRKQKKKTTKENDLGASLALKNMRELRPIIDEPLLEGQETQNALRNLVSVASDANEIGSSKDSEYAASNTGANSKPKEAIINPNDFIVAKPKLLLTAVPDVVTAGDEALDDEYEENHQAIISEAFAEDDVVDKFRKEKDDEIENNKIKDVDLNLPGWGSWGGKGVVPKKRRNNRLFIKAPQPAPRKDDNKSNVVIKENKAKEIRQLQVCKLPNPFTSVHDFEASIRAPIGNTFIPQTAHEKLIKPAVITETGKVIKPMDEEFLVNNKVFKFDE